MRRLTSLVVIVLALALAAMAGRSALANPSIIPLPVNVQWQHGIFRITNETKVVADARSLEEAQKLIRLLSPAMGYGLPLADVVPDENAISLAISDQLATSLGAEGYTLIVTSKRIVLRAAEPAGLFYGIQTLRQLLPIQVFSSKRVEGIDWTVPCVKISDYPRFAWRGLLIDPARHFIPVEDVKHYLEAMAIHKFNRLQMHLTDNEGWRIEIKKYPKLAAIGSQMDWSFRYKNGEGPRCRGYYSQDEVRSLVRFATDLHITIVPEIEMPYHAGAMIVAYPEHGVNMQRLANLPLEERWQAREGDWRPNSGLLGPRPATVEFMTNVLGEVLELFPSKFIHIGGDEANLKVWSEDPEMRQLMQTLGCRDAHELHSWFIKQIDDYLTKRGRRMIGWDEILQGGLAPGATVMSWRGTAGGIAAAKAGHNVIMTPTSHTYFDYRQHAEELGLGNQVLTLEKVYRFDPIPTELDSKQSREVLGGQGQLWGELIADRQRRDFMTWPRACALVERLWSAENNGDFDLFLRRLAPHLDRLANAGIAYRPPDSAPRF
jgi:hexosaminidase